MNSKCPFCLNEYIELEEVKVDDGTMACVVCSNCGLRGPGGWIEDGYDDSDIAWDNWNTMAQIMGTIWNKELYPVGMAPKVAKSLVTEPLPYRTIKIITDGRAVWDIENLPDGWDYEVEDDDETE